MPLPLPHPPTGGGKSPFLAVGAILAIVLAVGIACWDSARELGPLWNGRGTRTYTHGWIIAALCLWLLFRDRVVLGELPRQRHAPALAGVVLGGLIWYYGNTYAYLSVELGALPIIAWSGVCTCLGLNVGRRTLFHFGFFYLSLPHWSQFDGMLVAVNVFIQHAALTIAGISHVVIQNQIELAVGTFEIESSCNGMHYVLVASTVAALAGEMHRLRFAERAMLLMLAVATALAANTLRIFSLILMGHLTGMTHPLVQEGHYGYGWLIFSLTLLIFILLAGRRANSKLD